MFQNIVHDLKFIFTQFTEDRLTPNQYLLYPLLKLRSISHFIWKRKLGRFGNNTIIKPTVYVAGARRIEIGNYVKVQNYVNLHAYTPMAVDGRRSLDHHFRCNYEDAKLIIDDNVTIGPYAYIAIADHFYKDKESLIVSQGMDVGRIHIGEDVWIGAYAVIVGNLKIGKGAVIGAHSLVKEDVEAYSIVGGIPGRVIGQRS